MAAAKKNKFKSFFKDIGQELKKVIWPTKQQLVKSTITVIVVCIIMGTLIWVFDWGLSALIKNLIRS